VSLGIVVTIVSVVLQGSNLQTGWNLFNEGKYHAASASFERSISDQPQEYGPRLGLALAEAAQGHVKQSEQNLRTAELLAKSPEQKLDYLVGAIRVYTLSEPSKDWISKARSAFENGLRINAKYPALQYRMAQAYAASNDLGRAQDLFAQAVAMHGEFANEADKEWKKVQKILRASPATRKGAGIAMQDRVSRADLCALLVGEAGLDKLFEGANLKPAAGPAEPSDIKSDPLRREIAAVLKWRIRGLDVRPDGGFAPNDAVSRGELAFILEDILIKSTKDATLATRNLGADTSPFPDVPPTHALFNAVMTVTSRGIVEAELDGRYHPDNPSAGADVLIALRRLVTPK
jgi:tetratricopeptide (TPR) repeat protein